MQNHRIGRVYEFSATVRCDGRDALLQLCLHPGGSQRGDEAIHEQIALGAALLLRHALVAALDGLHRLPHLPRHWCGSITPSVCARFPFCDLCFIAHRLRLRENGLDLGRGGSWTMQRP
ncbi:MAG: hypothetical protein AB7I98_21635 [Verrucomicrobiales bacterium]